LHSWKKSVWRFDRKEALLFHLSVLTHVYNGKEAIFRQLHNWMQIPATLRRQIEFIVVDDYSDEPLQLPACNLNLSLYRVDEDIAWNQPGCRNLAALMARAPWLLFFDADNVLAPIGFDLIMQGLDRIPRRCLYTFARIEAGQQTSSHVNTFLVPRDAFFAAGPYDEDFCGHYGYDDIMLRNLWSKNIGDERFIADIMFQQLSMSTQSLNRDLHTNRSLLIKKLAQGLPRPKGIVRFHWSMVERREMPPPERAIDAGTQQG